MTIALNARRRWRYSVSLVKPIPMARHLLGARRAIGSTLLHRPAFHRSFYAGDKAAWLIDGRASSRAITLTRRDNGSSHSSAVP